MSQTPDAGTHGHVRALTRRKGFQSPKTDGYVNVSPRENSNIMTPFRIVSVG